MLCYCTLIGTGKSVKRGRAGDCHPVVLGPNLIISWIVPSLGRAPPRILAPAPARQEGCSSSDQSCPAGMAQLAAAGQWGALSGVKATTRSALPNGASGSNIIVQPLDWSRCLYISPQINKISSLCLFMLLYGI